MSLLLNEMGYFQKTAESNFNDSGHLAPVLFLNKGNGVEIYAIAVNGPEFKDAVYQIISKAIQKEGLQEFIFIVEAWMAGGDEAFQHVRKGQSLETLQTRREVVTMQYACPMKEHLHFADIIRPEGQKPYIGKWEATETDQTSMPQCVAANSRFNFLWQRLATGQN